MDHILVIGGTGNIGYPLIEILATNDQIKLTVGVHTVSKVQKAFQQLPLVPFDFLDPKTFPKAFKGVNKVFFIRPPQLSTKRRHGTFSSICQTTNYRVNRFRFFNWC